LAAILGMALPHALHTQALARLRTQQAPDDGQQVTVTVTVTVTAPCGRDACNGVAGFLVGICNALQNRLKGSQGHTDCVATDLVAHAPCVSSVSSIYERVVCEEPVL